MIIRRLPSIIQPNLEFVFFLLYLWIPNQISHEYIVPRPGTWRPSGLCYLLFPEGTIIYNAHCPNGSSIISPLRWFCGAHYCLNDLSSPILTLPCTATLVSLSLAMSVVMHMLWPSPLHILPPYGVLLPTMNFLCSKSRNVDSVLPNPCGFNYL